MSEVRITTLTPVHVGSGEFLKNNTDFVEFNDGSGSCLSVIDPKKILEIIGVDNVEYWVNLIERNGDTKDFVAKFGRNATPDKYALRVINNYASVNPNDTLKECIHDGLGRAYIPGSSIKGAIRTAVLATLAKDFPNLDSTVSHQDNSGKRKVEAKRVEAKFFGSEPNGDIFRFVRIGDAYFDKGVEMAARLVNLNIRKQESLIDKSKPQIVEAIDLENESVIHVKIDNEYYSWAKKRWPKDNPKVMPMGIMPDCMKDLSTMFNAINDHTKALVEDEIEYWTELEKNGYDGAADYIDNLSVILRDANSCKKNKECVMRLGHASGWRFITGAWTENLNSFENAIVPASRPNNNQRYSDYDFPKSRRLDEEGYVFGFVKMSIVN